MKDNQRESLYTNKINENIYRDWERKTTAFHRQISYKIVLMIIIFELKILPR